MASSQNASTVGHTWEPRTCAGSPTTPWPRRVYHTVEFETFSSSIFLGHVTKFALHQAIKSITQGQVDV